jgi:hypothetical protein
MGFYFACKKAATRLGATIVSVLLPNHTTAERLKRVSINGRVAFGTTCVELALEHFELLQHPYAKQLLAKLWDFVSSSDLGEWEESIEIYSAAAAAAGPNSEPMQAADAALRRWYASLPLVLIELVDNVLEIGRANLYAATVGPSATTLDATMRVVALMKLIGLPLPSLTPFEKSSFAECHGWGNRVNRAFFLEG